MKKMFFGPLASVWSKISPPPPRASAQDPPLKCMRTKLLYNVKSLFTVCTYVYVLFVRFRSFIGIWLL